MKPVIIAAHQPNFLPYLGLFYKIYKSDKFIFVDDVQFSNQNGISHHKNYIKTPQGRQLLRISVRKDSSTLINQANIIYDENWLAKMEKTLYLNYGRASYYRTTHDWLFGVLERKYEKLSELNIALIMDISIRMGLGDDFDNSSRYEIPGEKEELVVNLVEFFGGAVYYSGTGAVSYLHGDAFAQRNMRLEYSDYTPIYYQQQWGAFIENLSVIDYLFNCGFRNPFIGKNLQ